MKLKLLIGAVIIAVVLLIISLLVNPSKKETKKVVIKMPVRVVIPTMGKVNTYSDTGAKYISPTNQQYTLDWLIGNLRNKMPISNGAFSMTYDYKIDKFVVTVVDNSAFNQKQFTDWMNAAGYNIIPVSYFKFQ
jgi:hypothetical protein